MKARHLGILAVLIVVVLGLQVWRGQPSDLGHQSRLNYQVEKRSDSQLASTAPVPSRGMEILKVQNEALPSRDKKRIQILDEILDLKNDNDLRLDTEFRQMSPELKRSLELKYSTVSREKLNERGTLVFLLGREIKTEADLKFIAGVAKEAPCLGMSDCRRADPLGEGTGVHQGQDSPEQVMSERTLVYPQTVAMKSLERYLMDANSNPALRQSAIKTLREMAHQEDKRISSVAQAILQKYPQ